MKRSKDKEKKTKSIIQSLIIMRWPYLPCLLEGPGLFHNFSEPKLFLYCFLAFGACGLCNSHCIFIIKMAQNQYDSCSYNVSNISEFRPIMCNIIDANKRPKITCGQIYVSNSKMYVDFCMYT